MIVPVALGPTQRAAALAGMAERELDVLVVGGGVVGAGVALDAATRGLSVGLVEARDVGAGTSSRSSRLVHGGLRYLEMYDFALVREALHERALHLHLLAPHLVRPVPFLYPLTRHGWERGYVRAGLTLYDSLAALAGPAGRLPWHRHLSRRAALAAVPGLRPDSLVGAVRYWDAQVDDARHTLTLARTAASYGALVAPRAAVVSLRRDGGRVTGATVRDLEGDRELEVRARVVVVATGVWTEQTLALAGLDAGAAGVVRVRASKGVHLVVPRERIRSDTGLILRTPTSVLFVIPSGRHWLVGTTDTDWPHDPVHPLATAADVDYLLDQVNRVLACPLTRADIVGVYAGLRPLLAGEAVRTSRLSREHVVVRPAPGLVAVTGGKYTTYRLMAADAVDAAARDLPVPVPASCTQTIPLVGAQGWAAARNARARTAAATGLPLARVEHLLGRYGSLTGQLLELVAADPALGGPLPGAPDYLGAEVVYAVTHEGALRLEDVLTRRTHAALESGDDGVGAARAVAVLMAGPLGWSPERVDAEIAGYVEQVAADRRAWAGAQPAMRDSRS